MAPEVVVDPALASHQRLSAALKYTTSPNASASPAVPASVIPQYFPSALNADTRAILMFSENVTSPPKVNAGRVQVPEAVQVPFPTDAFSVLFVSSSLPARVATVPLEGRVRVVSAAVEKVSELDPIFRVFPFAIVRVPVDEVIVSPFMEVAVATPRLGVVRVGEVSVLFVRVCVPPTVTTLAAFVPAVVTRRSPVDTVSIPAECVITAFPLLKFIVAPDGKRRLFESSITQSCALTVRAEAPYRTLASLSMTQIISFSHRELQ
jgi:hypothetical protein